MRRGVLGVLFLALVACGESSTSDPPVEPPAHQHHEHHAPHGGSLQVLGDEFAHVELVVDPASGRITAYVLDGEAQHPIRVTHDALNLTIGADVVVLRAVASELTGETVGDTSQFEGVSGKLRAMPQFEGTLETITVRCVQFDAVRIGHPGGNEERDHAGR